MTRDEAIDVLKNSIWYYPPDVTSDEYDDRTDVYIAAEMAIDALKQQPQPDAETGLMPCGCGGKVAIAKYPGFLDTPDLYQVDCFECFVGTKPTMSPGSARIAWNRAMGWKGGAE